MFQIGTAAADITPPPGSMMACFPLSKGNPRRAEGAHDPLTVRCAVITDANGECVAFCSCDLAGIRDTDVQRIRSAVGQAIPELAGPRCIIAATHTHSSPETLYLFGNTPDDPWMIQMCQRIADTIVQAHANRQPARLRVGRGMAALSHNRRVRSDDGKTMTMVYDYDPARTIGPCDDDLPVLVFDDEAGQPVSIIYNFAAHPLTVGPGNLQYTADFPGVVNAKLETQFPRATAMFLNGAAGDVHPRQSMRKNFDAMQEIGSALTQIIVDAVRGAAVSKMNKLALVSDVLTFPNRMDSSQTVSVEVSCLRLGDVLMAFIPGEPFVAFQLQFKEAVAPATGMFVGYVNGWPGYMPPDAAYDEGGYGVDAFESDPPVLSRTALPRGAGELVYKRLIQLADELMA